MIVFHAQFSVIIILPVLEIIWIRACCSCVLQHLFAEENLNSAAFQFGLSKMLETGMYF